MAPSQDSSTADQQADKAKAKTPAPEAEVQAANDTEAAESEWVYVRLDGHGDDVEPARVTRKSFEKKWSKKGYAIVDPTQTGTEAASSE